MYNEFEGTAYCNAGNTTDDANKSCYARCCKAFDW